MEYQQEFLHTVKDDLQSLIELHWDEIALNKDVIKLNPDWERYEFLQEHGGVQCFTARDSGKLVGYFAVVTQANLHYKDHIFATNDVLYLHPDYRKEESSGLPADDTIELTPEEIAEMERVCNEPPPF